MSTTVTIGGVRYEGWKSVSMSRSIESAASSFSFSSTLRWPGDPNPLRARPGDQVVIMDDGDEALTGYIDVDGISTDEETEAVNIPGRSKTGDLIDSSACYVDPAQYGDMDAQVHLPREFNGMTPLSIMTALAAPFGVNVEYVIMGLTVNDPMYIPIQSYSAMPGERAFEAIERLARTMSVLVTDNAQGDLVLIRFDEFSTNNPFGAKVPIIKVGGADGNAKIADGLFSFEQRYSHVIVRGQRPGTASDSGATVSSQLGRARDPEVLRRRVLIVDADEPSSIAQLNARAAWEAATRAGRGVSVTYEMEGWRWGDGSQKEPGQLVRVIDPPRGIDATMLLVTAGWSEDSEEKQSTVTLAPPGGYEMLAPEKRQASGRKAITNGDDYNVWLTAEQVRTIKREAGQ